MRWTRPPGNHPSRRCPIRRRWTSSGASFIESVVVFGNKEGKSCASHDGACFTVPSPVLAPFSNARTPFKCKFGFRYFPYPRAPVLRKYTNLRSLFRPRTPTPTLCQWFPENAFFAWRLSLDVVGVGVRRDLDDGAASPSPTKRNRKWVAGRVSVWWRYRKEWSWCWWHGALDIDPSESCSGLNAHCGRTRPRAASHGTTQSCQVVDAQKGLEGGGVGLAYLDATIDHLLFAINSTDERIVSAHRYTQIVNTAQNIKYLLNRKELEGFFKSSYVASIGFVVGSKRANLTAKGRVGCLSAHAFVLKAQKATIKTMEKYLPFENEWPRQSVKERCSIRMFRTMCPARMPFPDLLRVHKTASTEIPGAKTQP
ncbi:hypothetical protein B0H14DRAFT_3167162, partial [Mycena olivaceomarginata]